MKKKILWVLFLLGMVFLVKLVKDAFAEQNNRGYRFMHPKSSSAINLLQQRDENLRRYINSFNQIFQGSLSILNPYLNIFNWLRRSTSAILTFTNRPASTKVTPNNRSCVSHLLYYQTVKSILFLTGNISLRFSKFFLTYKAGKILNIEKFF